MTELTPEIKEKMEKELDDIVRWTAEQISPFPMAEFKRNWAERFFSGDTDIQERAKLDWEATVALGRNKPVFLFDENNEIKWVFPPLVGEFEPRYSGDENSIFSLVMQLRTMSNVMSRQAEMASERIFPTRLLNVHQKDYWQRRLHEIRVECGIPYPGETTISDTDRSVSSPTLKDDPDEYDF